jgi:hypothetical protein
MYSISPELFDPFGTAVYKHLGLVMMGELNQLSGTELIIIITERMGPEAYKTHPTA